MDHIRYLDLTLEEAELARKEQSAPVGSVIVASNGTVISRGRNRVLSSGDQTAHAEVDAIRNAGAAVIMIPNGSIGSAESQNGHILYTSAEPCMMCLGAILHCRIDTIVWAVASAAGSAYDALLASGYQNERVRGFQVVREPSPEHRSRSRAVLRDFYLKHGNLRLAILLADS
jgi:tRNA(adenine34) deaminase